MDLMKNVGKSSNMTRFGQDKSGKEEKKWGF